MTPYELESRIRHRTIDALLANTDLSWEDAERRAVRALAPSLKAKLVKAKRCQPSRKPDQSGGSPRETLIAMLDRINVKALRSLMRYRISPQKLAAMEAALEGNAPQQRVLGVYDGGPKKRNKAEQRRYAAFKTDDGRTFLQRLNFSEYDK